jgi:hypothetical protein
MVFTNVWQVVTGCYESNMKRCITTPVLAALYDHRLQIIQQGRNQSFVSFKSELFVASFFYFFLLPYRQPLSTGTKILPKPPSRAGITMKKS